MREDNINRKLSVFGFDGLQNLITLFDILQRENISIKEIRKFVKSSISVRETSIAKRIKEMDRVTKLWNKNTRHCPTCMKPLMVRSVTIPKGKGNLKGYTCHWFCQQEDCNFEEYTYEDFKEVYTRIMGGR